MTHELKKNFVVRKKNPEMFEDGVRVDLPET